jgi:hypothetical protein
VTGERAEELGETAVFDHVEWQFCRCFHAVSSIPRPDALLPNSPVADRAVHLLCLVVIGKSARVGLCSRLNNTARAVFAADAIESVRSVIAGASSATGLKGKPAAR